MSSDEPCFDATTYAAESARLRKRWDAVLEALDRANQKTYATLKEATSALRKTQEKRHDREA